MKGLSLSIEPSFTFKLVDMALLIMVVAATAPTDGLFAAPGSARDRP